MPSQYVSGHIESTAKDSISELAYCYMIISEHILQDMIPPSDPEITDSYKEMDVETIDLFPMFYEDVVRVLINDMDRKQMWLKSSFSSNQVSLNPALHTKSLLCVYTTTQQQSCYNKQP
jgi:hypothetical protein